jgi:hypothetical protein
LANGAKSRGRSVSQSGEVREPVVSTCRCRTQQTSWRPPTDPPERNERSRTRVARRRVRRVSMHAGGSGTRRARDGTASQQCRARRCPPALAHVNPRTPRSSGLGFPLAASICGIRPGGLQPLSSRSLSPTPVSRDRPGALSRPRPRVGSRQSTRHLDTLAVFSALQLAQAQEIPWRRE